MTVYSVLFVKLFSEWCFTSDQINWKEDLSLAFKIWVYNFPIEVSDQFLPNFDKTEIWNQKLYYVTIQI